MPRKKRNPYYTTQSPDYPTSPPSYRSNHPTARIEALTVAEIAARFGVRERVSEDDKVIWESINCKPAKSQ